MPEPANASALDGGDQAWGGSPGLARVRMRLKSSSRDGCLTLGAGYVESDTEESAPNGTIVGIHLRKRVLVGRA